VHGTLPGPRRVLNEEEDQALVEYMKYLAVTIPATSNQHEAVISTSSTLCRTGRFRIPTMKAVDTYDVLFGSSDEEDDACFLCGKTQPPELISGNVDWIAC